MSGKTHVGGGGGGQVVGSRSGSLKKCRQRSFFEDDYRHPGDEVHSSKTNDENETVTT